MTNALSACQELTHLAAHATQVFLESADSITSSTLPDPDIFAFDNPVPPLNIQLSVQSRITLQKIDLRTPGDWRAGFFVERSPISNVKVSGSGRMQVCHACLA